MPKVHLWKDLLEESGVNRSSFLQCCHLPRRRAHSELPLQEQDPQDSTSFLVLKLWGSLIFSTTRLSGLQCESCSFRFHANVQGTAGETGGGDFHLCCRKIAQQKTVTILETRQRKDHGTSSMPEISPRPCLAQVSGLPPRTSHQQGFPRQLITVMLEKVLGHRMAFVQCLHPVVRRYLCPL